MISSGASCCRIQSLVIALINDSEVLSGRMEPADQRIASSIQWLIMIRLWNRMSHWTTRLKDSASLTCVMLFGVGLHHSRQIRQVSSISFTILMAAVGAPANRRSCIMRAAGARHSLMCKRRSVRLTTPASTLCNSRSARRISWEDHSAGPVSACVPASTFRSFLALADAEAPLDAGADAGGS